METIKALGARLLTAAVTVRTRSTEAAASARATVVGTVSRAGTGLVQRGTAAKDAVGATISRVSQGIVDTRAGIARRGAAAKEGVYSLVTGARVSARSNWALIQKEGVKVWAVETGKSARIVAGKAAAGAKERAIDVATKTSKKTTELYTATREIVSQRSFQTTVASAATGAVTLGAGGGVTGLAAGGVAGAAAGVPFALFTFGLSIPIGAALGGGAGLIAGATAGATTGAVGGGAAGYGVYKKKDDIRGALPSAASLRGALPSLLTKAGDSAGRAKGAAVASVGYVKGAVVDVASAGLARVRRPSRTGSMSESGQTVEAAPISVRSVRSM